MDLIKDLSTPLQGHTAGSHKLFYVGFYNLGDPVLQGRKHITKQQLCDQLIASEEASYMKGLVGAKPSLASRGSASAS